MARDYLFGKADWYSVERDQQAKMRSEIGNLASNQILNSSLDDLADYFEEKYTLSVPTLNQDTMVADQREKDIDVTNDRNRHWITPGPHILRGTELSLTLEFTGDAELFHVRPSSYTMNPPQAEVGNGRLFCESSTRDWKLTKSALNSIGGWSTLKAI